jgi:hypothetical protein
MKFLLILACMFSATAFAQSDESWSTMHQTAELENLADAVDANTRGHQNCGPDRSEEIRILKKQVELLKELNRRGVKVP